MLRALTPALLVLTLTTVALGESRTEYLRTEGFDWKALLPPPVASDSAEQHAELDLIVAVQTAASPAGIAEAKARVGHMDVNSFADILGAWFKPNALPRTDALFQEIEAESKKLVTGPAKKFFKRVRPADADKRVIGHEKEDEYSYPSGHSTCATMYAYILADLFPELKEKLLDRSEQIGFNRIIVGAHYPSDVVAGRFLGKSMALRLLTDPAFQKALADCKREMTAARAGPGHALAGQ